VGYSMGGMVAQQLAADAPERVRRLVLAATSPGVGAAHGDLRALLNILTPVRYASPRLYAKTIGTLAGGRARTDQAWVAQQGALRLKHAPSWRGYAGQIASVSGWSSLPFLPRIAHPVLVLAGDDDPLTPVVNGMLVAHLLPNARLLVLEGEGHLMLMDVDSGAQSAIQEFLNAASFEDSGVWHRATDVDARELEMGLAATTWQVPPLSILARLMRRRWVSRPAKGLEERSAA
jgi:pimeloyl-ACP methyl ester carboxylesterase